MLTLLPDILPMVEVILVIAGVFITYILRKTDGKIDKTASDLSAHKLEVVLMNAIIRSDSSRDFATKLELREVEKRYAEANREIQVKLDRLIDRLIDHPHR